jgi:hypothetical protein
LILILFYYLCLFFLLPQEGVLAEGTLQKHSPSKVLVKRWQTRYFVLSSSSPSATTLAYFKRKGGTTALLLLSAAAAVPLSLCTHRTRAQPRLFV